MKFYFKPSTWVSVATPTSFWTSLLHAASSFLNFIYLHLVSNLQSLFAADICKTVTGASRPPGCPFGTALRKQNQDFHRKSHRNSFLWESLVSKTFVSCQMALRQKLKYNFSCINASSMLQHFKSTALSVASFCHAFNQMTLD